MITGRIPVAIAYCPDCDRNVHLNEASRDEDPLAGLLDDPTMIPWPEPYELMHHAPRPPYTSWVEHRWSADGFETRLVFAMELNER